MEYSLRFESVIFLSGLDGGEMGLRWIKHTEITKHLKPALVEMNISLPPDVKHRLEEAEKKETGLGKRVLERVLENTREAEKQRLPLCQDTGMVVGFVEMGRQVMVDGQGIKKAIHNTIEETYREGFFRKSVVQEPVFERRNTKTNLPPVLYFDVVEGEKLSISLLAKGFGSENCSRVYMLKPTAGKQQVIDAVCRTIYEAGGLPCPPVVVGVGIGGTMDCASVCSKKALLRPLDGPNAHPLYSQMEQELYQQINALGIGPGGLGGKTTALGVKVEYHPTHIAGLPVAVSVNCWADRKTQVVI
ncbi:MAG: fumarate hydratase [Spirochaetota bacterium]